METNSCGADTVRATDISANGKQKLWRRAPFSYMIAYRNIKGGGKKRFGTEETMNLEIANRLVALRKENHLSQEALAEKLGISRQAVSKWERAEASPDTDNLIALARLYHVSLDELLKIHDEEENDGTSDDGCETETQLQTVMTEDTGRDGSGYQSRIAQDASEGCGTGREAGTEGMTTGHEDRERREEEDWTAGHGDGEWKATEEQTAGQGRRIDEDEVHIGLQGIHVRERTGDEVHIGWNGIHVHDRDNEVHIDKHGIYVNGEEAGGHIFTRGKDSPDFPLWLLAIVIYIVTGFFFNLWTTGWLIFFLVPVVGSLIHAVRRRNGYLFAYPVFVVFVYLYIGMVHYIWHPTWVIFLTIPLYYSFLGYIRGRDWDEEEEEK